MRVTALLLTLLTCLAAVPVAFAQTSPSPPPTVIELFTSQGCSSCPAADALLKTYIDKPGIMALSFSVDYWDHLGWKDTLASPKNTARQKIYAKVLGTGNIYTPQLVVDGVEQAVGSHKVEVDKAIEQSRKLLAKTQVVLKAASDGKRFTIDVGGTGHGAAPSATVWLAVVAPRVEVEVKRGENRGQTLAYHNVVRELSAVGMWSGTPMKIELPANMVIEPGARCAVLLQSDDGGRILGATWMTP